MANRVVGLDPGTMFFQSAEGTDDGLELKMIRNAFVELHEDDGSGDTESLLKNNDWTYIKNKDKFYVIGEDALRVAKMLPGKVELRRPLQGGVLNKNEDMKMIILSELIRQTIGEGSGGDTACTCVSSESVDESADSKFHKSRLQGMFKNLGWNVDVIDEAYAIILSENPTAIEDGEEVKYTGVAVSFGAGRVNCVLSRRAMQIVGMSCAKSGDWIDEQVAEQTGVPISQVVSKKERKLDFDNLDDDDDVIFALDVYYTAMIQDVFSKFGKAFKKEEGEFDAPLKVVVAGGTSMPDGFCNKVKTVLDGMDLPFEVEEVIHASDPRNAVAKGCLQYARLQSRKRERESVKKEDKAEAPKPKNEDKKPKKESDTKGDLSDMIG